MITSSSIKDKFFKEEFSVYTLIAISSVLVGIWAVKDTIALRNALLVVGAIISLFYAASRIRSFLRHGKISLGKFTPLGILFFMFFWVLLHYFFFSKYPEIQLQELKSTWLRSLLAAILGLGSGIALHRYSKALNLFWMGAILSFLILVAQYIPRAYSIHNMYAMDWYGGYYIYIGKINAVLIGTLLIAGFGGMVLDQVKAIGFQRSRMSLFLFGFGVILVLFSYVFILDTRNGIGLAALILLSWIFYGCILMLRNRSWKLWDYARVIAISFIALSILAIFAFQQAKHNSGWNTLIEDSKIAMQTDKYPNWKNIESMGYPLTDEGRSVAGNTYERVAWGTVGVQLIPRNVLGIGVLNRTFGRILQEQYPGALPSSTHSAWIEFALAFGIPGIILMVGCLLSLIYASINSPAFLFKTCTWSLSLALLMVYALGELSTQHGVEILFYFLAFLSGLLLLSGDINAAEV